jgi:hypothetical protein
MTDRFTLEAFEAPAAEPSWIGPPKPTVQRIALTAFEKAMSDLDERGSRFRSLQARAIERAIIKQAIEQLRRQNPES